MNNQNIKGILNINKNEKQKENNAFKRKYHVTIIFWKDAFLTNNQEKAN